MSLISLENGLKCRKSFLKHPDIKVKHHLWIIALHNQKQEGPTVSFNAATTLYNFCVWQQNQNVEDDSHPSHHDTALLITRYNQTHA